MDDTITKTLHLHNTSASGRSWVPEVKSVLKENASPSRKPVSRSFYGLLKAKLRPMCLDFVS